MRGHPSAGAPSARVRGRCPAVPAGSGGGGADRHRPAGSPRAAPRSRPGPCGSCRASPTRRRRAHARGRHHRECGRPVGAPRRSSHPAARATPMRTASHPARSSRRAASAGLEDRRTELVPIAPGHQARGGAIDTAEDATRTSSRRSDRGGSTSGTEPSRPAARSAGTAGQVVGPGSAWSGRWVSHVSSLPGHRALAGRRLHLGRDPPLTGTVDQRAQARRSHRGPHDWRRRGNRTPARLCRPLPHHSATSPDRLSLWRRFTSPDDRVGELRPQRREAPADRGPAERTTGLEPATSTLARLRSTN